MYGKDRAGVNACMPGEEDDEICPEREGRSIQVDQSFVHPVVNKTSGLFRMEAKKPLHFVMDPGPCRICPGTNQEDGFFTHEKSPGFLSGP